MDIALEPSWKNALSEEFEKTYFLDLMRYVASEYEQNICFPPQVEIFAAFNECLLDHVKVVIIGQDPYHGENQANGLCFSVRDGIVFPPSLFNIFKEIMQDLGKEIPESGNLERWAKQGVLLLNATLTVRKSEAASHQKKGWETFTNAVIQKISDEKEGIVFLLWGGYAKKKGSNINQERHKVLVSGHPSPLSANKKHWFGNKHFSQANVYLKESGKSEIDW